MNSFYTLSNILRGKWLIDPGFAESQGAIIANILNRYTEFRQQEPDPLTAYGAALQGHKISIARYSWAIGWNQSEKDSVAVVKLKGPLLKDDQYCGQIGMETIGSILKQADGHPNIVGIVLSIDSPGGTVDGTEALATIVKNLQKPVIAHVNGMMTSAAAWIGTSADQVMSSTDTDEVGSIGVLLSFADFQPYWESMGIKFHTITATTSPEKVKIFNDLRQGKYEQYIKEVLDPLDEKFMRAIRENRPSVEDRHLTGKVFFAREVMGVFVDSIGTIEEAIAKVYDMAKEKDKPGSASDSVINAENNESHSTFLNMKYPNLAKALNLDNESFVMESDGMRSFSQEEMEAVENALGSDTSTELQSAVTTLESTLESVNQILAEREATIAQRDQLIAQREQRISELESENAALRGKPAETPIAAISETDPATADKAPKAISEDAENPLDAINEIAKEYLGKEL